LAYIEHSNKRFEGGFMGVYKIKCFNQDGILAWEDLAHNILTTQGKNHILDNYLAGAFYIGLISSVGYSALVAGDTATEINGTNGWKEAATANAPDYSELTRPAATFGAAASGGLKTTSSPASFSMSENGTLKGAFLCTSSVKDGTAGSIISEALFDGGDQAVTIGQIVEINYTV
jgi:hypothetical protein